MNRKTIVLTFDKDWREIEDGNWRVGDEVILCGRENMMVADGEEFYLVPHTGKGRPTNGNPAEFYYHGWLGTTNNVRNVAYGVRKVTGIREFAKTLHVTVGNDLHPDWE